MSSTEDEEDADDDENTIPSKVNGGLFSGPVVRYPKTFPPYLLEYIEQDRRMFEEEIEDNILAIVSLFFLLKINR